MILFLFQNEAEQNLYHLFNNDEFSQLLTDVAACISILLSIKTITNFAGFYPQQFMKFGALSLEYLRFILNHHSDFPVNNVEIFLDCADAIMKQENIIRSLDSKENLRWFCSAVNCIFNLVEILLKLDKPLPTIPNYFPSQSIQFVDNYETIVQTVHRLYILVTWFHDIKCINRTKIPQFLFNSIKTITINLSRLSITNSYLLVPLKAWKTGWIPESLSGNFGTQIPAMPVEILQDVEVLEEYIFRINFLGWTSRQQFEETWMGLLSIFCYPLDNMDALELNEILHSSSLAIKSITSLLLRTLTCSDVGNPVSNLLHVARNNAIPEDSVG